MVGTGFDEVGGALEVLAGEGVPDGLGTVIVLLVPLTRPTMQLRLESRVFVDQPRLEDVTEQVVVPIPETPVVERDEEQVGSFERVEHRLRVVPLHDGVAEFGGQAAQ